MGRIEGSVGWVVFEGLEAGEFSQGGIEGCPGEGVESVAALCEGGIAEVAAGGKGLAGGGDKGVVARCGCEGGYGCDGHG